MYRELPFLPLPERAPALLGGRRVIAALLRRAGAGLARLSLSVAGAAAQGRARDEPLVEFYAEAGAPEGALYVDGELVGTVIGVSRL